MTQIEIINEQSSLEVDRKKLERVIRFVLRKEGVVNGSLTILVGHDERIREFNRKFLGKDKPTDVIAFGVHEQETGIGKAAPFTDRSVPDRVDGRYLGDIVVSAETAVREHARYGSAAHEEFMRYVVHGVLHLLGYGDEDRRDFRRMQELQERYLVQSGVR